MRNVLGMLGLVLVASLAAACNVEPGDGTPEDLALEGAESEDDIGEAESALPGEEREIEYFSDATLEVVVGGRFITCDGVFTWGSYSKYWTASRITSCYAPYYLSNPGVGCYDYMHYCSAAYQSCINCY